MSASRNSSTGFTSQFADGNRPKNRGAASQLRRTWSSTIRTISWREPAVFLPLAVYSAIAESASR